MKIIELFAGIGACSVALKRIGIDLEIIDAVEIDKYAMASFNAIHNTNFETQDITTWNKDFKDIDLITHGSPCQDFSVAGKQAGGDIGSGTRSSLMYETIRIVGQVRPKYVLWENVKNLLSVKHKHNFDAYIDTINVLGYNSYYQVLNAKDYGIPQNRERVYTISIRKDIDKGKFKFPEKEELKLKLKNMLEDEVDEKYYLKDYQLENIKKSNYIQNQRRIQEKDYCDTLCARDWKDPKCIKIGNLKSSYDQSGRIYDVKGVSPTIMSNSHIGGYIPPKIIENEDQKCIQVATLQGGKWDKINESCRRVYSEEGIAPTVHTCQGGNTESKIMINNGTKKGYDEATDGDSINLSFPNSKTRRGRVGHQVSQTIQCNDLMGVVENNIKVIGNYMPSNHDASRIVDNNGLAPTVKENHGTVTATNYGLRIRKLIPKECWRLMGFSDEDFEKVANIPTSNTQLYKQAGNSIVVNVLEKIFKNLFMED